MQTTLGMRFENLRTKRIEFVESLSSEHELVISFPSFSTSTIHYCHYKLPHAGYDYCSCPGDSKPIYNCWHIKYRPLILKLFLNHDLSKRDFMEFFETVGAFDLNQCCIYIINLMRSKNKPISALDLNDLSINRTTRRIVGSAFLRLKKLGIIQEERGYAHGDSKQNARHMKLWGLRKDAPDYEPVMMGVKV